MTKKYRLYKACERFYFIQLSKNRALNDGADQLKTATDTIIDKLGEKEDGLDEFVTNFNKVNDAARDYQSFGGIQSDKSGKTKFIIKVDGIGENKE